MEKSVLPGVWVMLEPMIGPFRSNFSGVPLEPGAEGVE